MPVKSGKTLYIAVGSDHKPINKQLEKYAAKQVKATGQVKELDGLNMIFVENVEEQK